jgi:hypothetical protein
MGKPKGKRTGSSGAAAAKKDKDTGRVASTFSKANLNKMRAAGLLDAATEVMMPGEEIVTRHWEDFRGMFSQFLFYGLSLSQSTSSFVDCSLYTVCSFTSSHPTPSFKLRALSRCANASLVSTPIGGSGAASSVSGASSPRPLSMMSVVPSSRRRAQPAIFDLQMKDSVQDWRKKWFYDQD